MPKHNNFFIKHARFVKPIADPVLTIIFWTYFTLGFVLFFSPFYLLSYFFPKNREQSFQKLNHLFYRGFFKLVRNLAPGISIHISDDVLSIRSSVIVSNHLSYLDPILLISLYEKQKTIVKSTFFRVPIFGWMLKMSGYLPSVMSGDVLMIAQMEKMGEYLAAGGNLFVFPEGTRSRDGKIGDLNKGAFKIARLCKSPVKILRISNSGDLFRPGKFFFSTCVPINISVELAGEINPDYEGESFTVSGLTAQVREIMERNSE
ncbi:MAG: lysophospholipid acyltransferase family protein [Desulfococcaceae bacterium]